MRKHSRVCAYIDLNAILYNMESMRRNISEKTKIIAVIKTDGYGHGAVEIAKELESLDYVYGYAVATVEEGMILRRNGMKKPILILGRTPVSAFHKAVKKDIRPTIFHYEDALALSQAAKDAGIEAPFHFAVDTGMSRLGFQATEESADLCAEIARLPGLISAGLAIFLFFGCKALTNGTVAVTKKIFLAIKNRITGKEKAL